MFKFVFGTALTWMLPGGTIIWLVWLLNKKYKWWGHNPEERSNAP